MATEPLVHNALKPVDFKIFRSENSSGSGGGSSVKSNLTCHKYGKKGYIKKYFRSKGTGYIAKTPEKSANKCPEWVTKNDVISDTKYIVTCLMNHKKKK